MLRTVKTVPQAPKLEHKKRVAAYARVSSGKDAMLHSLSAQISYYSTLIQNHGEWLYVGVYADEAKTGTKDTREDFQRLISDCHAGKIDMVITKSISRFARNTVTLLQTVREFKAMEVDIYFEEQNIHTMSGDGELMMTILASYAQEESRSASENQKWRVRKSFENGELVNLRFLFGYRISRHSIEIDPDTAPIVREIFDRVIAGESFGGISRDLNKRGIVRVLGGTWSARRVREIVANEKYTGNALLQKRYRNNHIEKKQQRNVGELPMYYAENTHPAIIDMATFEAAQVILQKVAATHEGWQNPKQSEITGKIICPLCGKNYKRNTSNGSVGWNCATYLTEGKKACHGKKIPDATLKEVCTEVLGLKDYDPIAFSERIDHIEVPQDNHLHIFFKDGSMVERTWQDRSRRESWTQEMRMAAAERAKNRWRKMLCQE